MHLSFELHLFPSTACPAFSTWGHASGMCASKRRPDESGKFALQSSQKGLLPPLGGRINGLAGRYTPTTNMRLNTGSLVGGPNSTCVPENVLWCPSFVDRSPRRSHSPWPLSNERESECRPLIGCIFLLSHWLERGWAGSSTCTAPLGHLQPLEVDFWRHDMP